MQKLGAIKKDNGKGAELAGETEQYKSRGHRSDGGERKTGPCQVRSQLLGPGKNTWKENILVKQRQKDKDLIQQQISLHDWRKSKWEGLGRWLTPFRGKTLEQHHRTCAHYNHCHIQSAWYRSVMNQVKKENRGAERTVLRASEPRPGRFEPLTPPVIHWGQSQGWRWQWIKTWSWRWITRVRSPDSHSPSFPGIQRILRETEIQAHPQQCSFLGVLSTLGRYYTKKTLFVEIHMGHGLQSQKIDTRLGSWVGMFSNCKTPKSVLSAVFFQNSYQEAIGSRVSLGISSKYACP